LYEFKRFLQNHYIIFIILAFLAGCLLAGIVFNAGQGSAAIGRLDKRYDSQHRGAAEIIGRLEIELERERELNRQLRDHNNRARVFAVELTQTAERNVRNLQDAISLIGEIRRKIQVLENFYSDSNPNNIGN